MIVSEPSNPWIAGVAALFTREFFVGARDRLAPGGIMCQWANAYNISDADLRAIVATFRSVFPDGTVWLAGENDVLLVGSLDFARDKVSGPIDARLGNIARNWTRPGVAEDLKTMSVLDPFSIVSLLMGGPKELEVYSAGAPIFTDDRMTLEFTAPREIHRRSSGDNTAALARLLENGGGPAFLADAKKAAGATEWRHRGEMMAKADAFPLAYDDFVRALTADPGDTGALDGLVRTAVLTHRGSDALAWVKSLMQDRPPTAEVLVARSKLLASIDANAGAIEAAAQAAGLTPLQPQALEQLASLYADAGDTAQLDPVVEQLRAVSPDRAGTHYYAAVSALIHGDANEAVTRAQRAIAIDPTYAPVYDLIGAAETKLGQASNARAAFETSLTFDAHDSTAYTNLGLLELAAGNRRAAANYFAEALWLTPESTVARAGLARTK